MNTKQRHHMNRHGDLGRLNARAARRRYVRSRGDSQRWLLVGTANDTEKMSRTLEARFKAWVDAGGTLD